MSTIVYLSNENIQIIEGTPGVKSFTVKQAFTVDAPEGSIINGMVTDTELFVPFMQSVWQKYMLPKKDVILVINSTQFIGRRLELPKLNDKKTLEYIEREFSQVTREGEHIYGYVPVALDHSQKLNYIYAETVSEEFIKDYLDIFAEIGVSVRAVHSGESSIIGLINVIVGRQYKTFAVELVDKMSIHTLLWVDGNFYSFTSSRCFSDVGTPDHATDVARAVSQIMQFMKGNQIEKVLECVMLAGINELDLPMYKRELEQQHIHVSAQMLNTRMLVQAKLDPKIYVHAVGGMIINGKCQNFLNQYKHKNAAGSVNRELKRAIILVGSIFLVMMIALLTTMGVRISKEKENKKLKAYQEDPMVMMDVAAYRVQQAKYNFLSNQLDAIYDIDRNIYSYPICDSSMMTLLDMCAKGYADITFESFDAEQGTIAVIATAKSVDEINKFIKKLNEEKVFRKVDYTGYTFDENTKLWDIHVMCTLEESAGRDPHKAPQDMNEDDTALDDTKDWEVSE